MPCRRRQPPVSAGVCRTPSSKVGLFVDAEDAQLDATLDAAKLDMLQLHGAETPDRVREIKRRYGLPVMKAIPIAARDDVAMAERYFDAADWLLFDAKPPRDMDGVLPGRQRPRLRLAIAGRAAMAVTVDAVRRLDDG